jgi:hypothetical protein
MNGLVNVKLVNQTGTAIKYEVVGETNERTLQGRSYVTLQLLKTPVNINFERPDGGLIRIIPQADSQRGMLNVTLKEATDLAADNRSLSVQDTGNVFLN